MSGEKPLNSVLVPVHALKLAISFLTRFPAGNIRADDPRVWKLSLAFYPLCGYLIGAVAALPLIVVTYKTSAFMNIPFVHVSIFIYVAALEWLTRMLHLDGFCDCCDAFGAVADKERRLAIMKDPHVGASAVGGAIFLIVGKLMALNMLAYRCDLMGIQGLSVPLALIAIPVFGRLGIVFLASVGKYPRENGTALNVVGKVPPHSVVIAFFSVLFLLEFMRADVFVISLFLTILSVMFWKMKADSKLGGVTGDVLGACSETTELAVCLAILLHT